MNDFAWDNFFFFRSTSCTNSFLHRIFSSNIWACHHFTNDDYNFQCKRWWKFILISNRANAQTKNKYKNRLILKKSINNYPICRRNRRSSLRLQQRFLLVRQSTVLSVEEKEDEEIEEEGYQGLEYCRVAPSSHDFCFYVSNDVGLLSVHCSWNLSL